ncbi:MAG: MoaD/ThiS family protein [Eubacteriales bacterium]|nr:MoaD/ThiS family protein [Bacillota bacterium]
MFLYGKFRDKVAGSAVGKECFLEMEINEGDTIASVMERLDIAPDDVAHIFLNYQYSTANRKLHHGDRLAIFPIEMSVLYRQYFVKYND